MIVIPDHASHSIKNVIFLMADGTEVNLFVPSHLKGAFVNFETGNHDLQSSPYKAPSAVFVLKMSDGNDSEVK